MSICSTISPGFSLQRNCICAFYKFFHTDFKSIKTSLTFNCGEFAIIKGRVIDFFPYPYELKCVSIAKPICYKEITILFALIIISIHEHECFKKGCAKKYPTLSG